MDTLVYDPAYSEVLKFFGMSLDEFFAVKSKGAYEAFERGEITESEFRRTYFKDGRDFDLEGLKARLYHGYDWIQGIPELLGDLKGAGVTMHALSNYSEWYGMMETKLEVSRFLPWTFVSCRTGHRKPEVETYQFAATELGIDPANCIFVDDRPKNVAGAQAAGMRGVVFEGADQLRAALRDVYPTIEDDDDHHRPVTPA